MTEKLYVTVRVPERTLNLEQFRELYKNVEYLASVKINPLDIIRKNYPNSSPTERHVTFFRSNNSYIAEDRFPNPEIEGHCITYGISKFTEEAMRKLVK